MTEILAQMRMEWRLQWARPFVWFCLLASFGAALAATLENAYGAHGFGWVNGADAIGTRALLLSVLAVIAAAGIVGEAMSRDRSANAEELVMATGANPALLGLGRFAVTLAIMLLIGAMFAPGMMLGALAPGVFEQRLGPFAPEHYVKALFIYVFPNVFLVSALVYAVASRWRSQTAAFVVALGLIALYAAALMMLGENVYRHEVLRFYALLDPYGNIAGAEHAMGWTVDQRNRLFRPFEGLLLQNRVIWGAVACALVALGALAAPRFLQQPRQTRRAAALSAGARRSSERPFLAMIAWELAALTRQPGLLVLVGFAALTLWVAAASSITYNFSLPTTDLLIHTTDFYFDKLLVLLIVWFAAEITWRERDHNVDEIIDVLPVGDAARFGAKTIALLAIVAGVWLLAIAVNVAYQISRGFYEFDWGLYAVEIFLFKAPFYLWLAVLAIAMQHILRHRYIAMAVVLLIYLSPPLFDALGLYHPIYRFGEVSFVWYSPMDGYGHFWRAHLWFLLWWTLVCAVLWIVAWACAGRDGFRKERLTEGAGRIAFAATTAGALCVGAAILYQSVIAHRWPLFDENRYMAQVESRYRDAWAARPQPQIVALSGDIDLYPEDRRAEMRGEMALKNLRAAPIDEIIVFFHPMLKVAELDMGARARRDDERSTPHIQIWRLDPPLKPQEELSARFRTAGWPDPGFAARSRNNPAPQLHGVELVGNGTSLLNLNLIPAPGYSERLEHKPAWLRRRYGLDPQWSPPTALLGAEIAHDTTHLSWLRDFEVTVSTAADQIPLHAGELVSDHLDAEGRRHRRYRADQPARGWSQILSGRYEVHRAARPGLPPVELYHHPAHDWTLSTLSEALLDAMAHFRSRYGPPPFSTFRLGEESLHYEGFGARGGLGFMSEVLGWKSDLALSGGEDIRDYAAKLAGMSWWLDQITAANLPGAKSVLTGLPYWSAALYLHQARGPELSREIRLQEMLEAFRTRAGLEDEEKPFIEEMKISTMIRMKGALHIVYLAELVGVERLEAAQASFLEQWRFKSDPYPSAADLLAHLKRALPQDAHPQLDEFFRHVSSWRLTAAEAEAWPDGEGGWRLRAVLETGKWRSRGLGEEREAAGETPLPITIFGGDGFGRGAIIRQEWRSLPNGRHELFFDLDEKPARIGVDPFLYLPDPNPRDNVREVTIRNAAP